MHVYAPESFGPESSQKQHHILDLHNIQAVNFFFSPQITYPEHGNTTDGIFVYIMLMF